ncbi:hypothetical protein ACFVYG_23905 [Streptomyces sp. NPDC058256]|uniref:hypothetical protein n=1 Tax=Streptomyces sp. NPDC058256 TaxID=3346408 RepID=UPI0036E9624A
MGNRSKRGRKRGNPIPPEEVVEVANLPYGVMVRQGRFIETHGTRSQYEMEELIDYLSGPYTAELEEERQRASGRLNEIFAATDPLDLICRASLTYAQIDPVSFRESENDQLPSHIEFLALRALPHVENATQRDSEDDSLETAILTGEAIKLARELFDSTSNITLFRALKKSRGKENKIEDEYLLRTRIESMSVRGSGYPEHLTKILLGCFEAFDVECRRLLGYTAAEAVAVVHSVHNIVEDRAHPLRRAAAERFGPLSALLKRQRRKGSGPFPRWLVAASPNEGKNFLSMLVVAEALADSRNLCTVLPSEVAADSALPVESVKSVLDSFACEAAEYSDDRHEYPVGAHPLTERPVLKTSQGYILPVPAAMFESLRPRMEDLLRNAATGKLWERYLAARGKYLVREAVDLISGALPGSTKDCEIPWRSTVTQSDLDGLVFSDDVAFRIQGKAGRLHAAARRGAPGRMKKNIEELIEAAALQHQSLAEALQDEGAEAIGLGHYSDALRRRFQLEVIATLDDVTVWATDTHQLVQHGSLSESRPIPWVVSLADLMVVADLLHGSLLAHYVIRRQRLEEQAFVSAHDELDWVGHYLKEGLFFDRFLADGPDRMRLLSYTDPIDAWYLTRDLGEVEPAEKPTLGIPSELFNLLSRLEEVRPDHWITASLALIDGDEESWGEWSKFLDRAQQRIQSVGWSNATQVYNGRLGVTVYINHRIPQLRKLRREIEQYSRRKKSELGPPNWVTIGDSGGRRLIVHVIESAGEDGLERVFAHSVLPVLARDGL